jgi:phosphate starvation-inducible PhoH-like protein
MKKDTTLEFKSLSTFYKPKSNNQEKYCEHLNDLKTKIIFAIGPAGTGKTVLACNEAVKQLQKGTYQKIIITRPIVCVEEEEIGFLPGTINKKMDPWMRPIFDVFLEFYSQKDIDMMIYNNIIEISPLGFMRGRTFKKCFIIADEMQNSSPNQMMMLTTRIGKGSKMVITGDLKQTDKNIGSSGLDDIIKKIKLYDNNQLSLNNTDFIYHGIKIVELNKDDIEREPIISIILDIYDVNKHKIEKISNNDCAIIPKYMDRGFMNRNIDIL